MQSFARQFKIIFCAQIMFQRKSKFHLLIILKFRRENSNLAMSLDYLYLEQLCPLQRVRIEHEHLSEVNVFRLLVALYLRPMWLWSPWSLLAACPEKWPKLSLQQLLSWQQCPSKICAKLKLRLREDCEEHNSGSHILSK